MISGMSTSTFTLGHVLLSLAGIGSGFVVLFGLLARKRLDGWTALFLTTTVATSVTGFGFPFDHLLPSHKVGIVSLLVLALAIVARYPLHLAGAYPERAAVCGGAGLRSSFVRRARDRRRDSIPCGAGRHGLSSDGRELTSKDAADAREHGPPLDDQTVVLVRVLPDR
jgi:hypothetical protein